MICAHQYIPCTSILPHHTIVPCHAQGTWDSNAKMHIIDLSIGVILCILKETLIK